MSQALSVFWVESKSVKLNCLVLNTTLVHDLWLNLEALEFSALTIRPIPSPTLYFYWLVHMSDANTSANASNIHTLNADASRMGYARAFQYPKMEAILFPESALPWTSSQEARTLGTRLKMADEKTIEAWNEYFSSCICICVALVHTCGMQTQAQMRAQGNEKFSISCVGKCICIVEVHTCVCLCLYLHCSCEPALR